MIALASHGQIVCVLPDGDMGYRFGTTKQKFGSAGTEQRYSYRGFGGGASLAIVPEDLAFLHQIGVNWEKGRARSKESDSYFDHRQTTVRYEFYGNPFGNFPLWFTAGGGAAICSDKNENNKMNNYSKFVPSVGVCLGPVKFDVEFGKIVKYGIKLDLVEIIYFVGYTWELF